MTYITLLILQFLAAIQAVETNNGTIMNHRIIQRESSIHHGQTALSAWGLMPNTILMLKRDPEQVRLDPKYAHEVAKIYALKVLKRAKGCPYKAQIYWLMGPNYTIKEEDYKTNRAIRFNEEFSKYHTINDVTIIRWCSNE